MKSRLVAAIFAFFLGSFGIHKFYLNRPGKGILYLLFCWTFIPGLISFIEGILLILMTDDAFDYKDNEGSRSVKNDLLAQMVLEQNKRNKLSDFEALEKLGELREKQVITEREFQEKKWDILND